MCEQRYMAGPIFRPTRSVVNSRHGGATGRTAITFFMKIKTLYAALAGIRNCLFNGRRCTLTGRRLVFLTAWIRRYQAFVEVLHVSRG